MGFIGFIGFIGIVGFAGFVRCKGCIGFSGFRVSGFVALEPPGFYVRAFIFRGDYFNHSAPRAPHSSVGFLVHGWDSFKQLKFYSLFNSSTLPHVQCYPPHYDKDI